MEIERKFLVKKDDTFRGMVSSSSLIAQGYMDVKGATVRVRLRKPVDAGVLSSASNAADVLSSASNAADTEGQGKAYLTIKGPSRDGGISRYEFEREIPLEDAKEMLSLCHGGLIEKVRHLVPYEGHTFEVDEFRGANEGLLFCEVELQSPDEPFARPPFLGPEVTGIKYFYNKHMLATPYPLWRHTLPEEFR